MPKKLQPLAPLAVLGALLLALYLATLQRGHTWDATAYAARSIHDPFVSEGGPATRLFHPHHLLYVPLAIVWRGLLRLFGIGGGDPFLPLQVLNALLGAGIGVLTGAIVAHQTGRPMAALAAAAGCGLSNGVWLFSTEVEVMIPALFFYLLGVWLLARRQGRASDVGAVLSLAASVLLHQFAVLLVTPVLLASLRVRPRRQAALLAAAVLVLVLGTYAAAAVAAEHIRSPLAFLDWTLEMRHRSSFGHLAPARALWLAFRAFLESFVSLAPLWRWRSASMGAYGALQVAADLALLLALAAAASTSLPGVLRSFAGRDAATLAWTGGIACAVAFNLWFQPGVDDFWTYLPALVWILATTHTALVSRSRFAAAVLLLALGSANLAWRALPARDPRNAPYADQLDYARGHLARGDAIILGDGGAMLGEDLLALPLIEGVEIIVEPMDTSAAEAERFRAQMLSTLARQRRSGGKLVAPADALSAVRPFAPALQWSPADTLRGRAMFAAHER